MRVLIAIDDETYGKAIIDFAGAAFTKPGTLFKLLHIAEPSSVGDTVTAIYGQGINREILEERVKEGSALLGDMREQLQARVGQSSPVEVSVMIGTPHHVILEIADEWQADIIIMGSHGRKGLSRLIMGSVSMSVMSHANCAVTIVRLPREVLKEEETSAKKKIAKKPEKEPEETVARGRASL